MAHLIALWVAGVNDNRMYPIWQKCLLMTTVERFEAIRSHKKHYSRTIATCLSGGTKIILLPPKKLSLNFPETTLTHPPLLVAPLVALIRHVLQVTIPWLIVYSCLQGGYRGNVHRVQDAMDDVSLAGASPDMEARVVDWTGHGRRVRPIGEPGLDVKPHLD